jgi:hypothetical protein
MIMAYKDSPASILGLKLYNQRWDESNMRASVRSGENMHQSVHSLSFRGDRH